MRVSRFQLVLFHSAFRQRYAVVGLRSILRCDRHGFRIDGEGTIHIVDYVLLQVVIAAGGDRVSARLHILAFLAAQTDVQQFTQGGLVVFVRRQFAGDCRRQGRICGRVIAVVLELVIRRHCQVLLVINLDDVFVFPIADRNRTAIIHLGISFDREVRHFDLCSDVSLLSRHRRDLGIRAVQDITDRVISLARLDEGSPIITVVALSALIIIGIVLRRIQVLSRTKSIPYDNIFESSRKEGYGIINSFIVCLVDIVNFIRVMHIAGKVIRCSRNEYLIIFYFRNNGILIILSRRSLVDTGLAQTIPITAGRTFLGREGNHVVQRLILLAVIQLDGIVTVEAAGLILVSVTI